MAKLGLGRLAIGLFLATGACSGSISCGGCAGGPLDPIPGGFEPEALLERAVELRVTQTGLDFVGTEFADLVKAYASMECGAGEPVPCPTDFRISGQQRPTTCDVSSGVCVDATTMTSEPVLGFEIERAVQSGATVCRDALNDPARRSCFAWLRLEGLRMRPVAPNQVEATVSAQIYSTDIPIRYDALGMDCLVELDSNASGGPLQDFVITAELREWVPPAGTAGRQLEVAIVDVMGMIPDGDISIRRDPVHGGADDFLSCGIANVGAIKTALVARLVGSLASIIDEEVRSTIGWRCDLPGTEPCPADTSCNAENRCVQRDGLVVPQRLGTEGRIDFAALLGGFARPTLGQGDVSFLVGGPSGADSGGISLGMLGGMETAAADLRCAPPSISPRLRPGYTAPPPLPAVNTVDLDFDGTPERPYMMAAGVSQQLLDQAMWTAYASGLFCASISSAETELVNTGSLAVLMPSLQQLTHSDKYPWSIWPARVSIRPGGEPRIVIGEGRTSGMPPSLILESPLLSVQLPDLELSFTAMIEERWVHLMRATADVEIPLGVYADASGQLQLVVGDLEQSVTNVRVSDHDILAETQQELEQAVPALLSAVVPQLTDRLLVPISLPTAAELGGFELRLLGARGVPLAGGFSHLGVYLDLGFDPALAGNLSVAAETIVELSRAVVPSSEEMAVTNAGGPVLPELELLLSGHAPSGAELEHQLRIDGGPWSPFVRTRQLVLRRPELLMQGRHQIEVRARLTTDPRSLDPTPAVIEVVIDTEAPVLDARLVDAGAIVRVHDVVSRDRVTLELVSAAGVRELAPDARGFVALPELLEPTGEVAVRATDEAGRVQTVVLRAARAALAEDAAIATPNAGCRCAAPRRDALGVFAILGVLALISTRRFRR